MPQSFPLSAYKEGSVHVCVWDCSKGQQHHTLNPEIIVAEFLVFFFKKKKKLFDMKLNSKQIQNMKCVQNGNLLNQKPIWHMKYI